MTDEICIGKTLAEIMYVVGVPYLVCVSLYGGATLVTEIVEQSISVATMPMHEKGVPRYR